MGLSIVTLTEIKTHLPVVSGDTQFDTELYNLSWAATELLEDHCRYTFEKAARTEYFDTQFSTRTSIDLYGASTDGIIQSYNERILRLKARPIDISDSAEQALEVRYDLSRLWTLDATLLVQNTDWFFDAERNWIILNYPTVNALRSIRVKFTAGYTKAGTAPAETISATAPDKLKMAAIVQIMFMRDKLRSHSLGVKKGLEKEGEQYELTGILCTEAIQLVSKLRAPIQTSG